MSFGRAGLSGLDPRTEEAVFCWLLPSVTGRVYVEWEIQDAIRRTPTRQQLLLAGIPMGGETAVWSLWNDGGLISEPKPGDKVRDSAGVDWFVRRVDAKLDRSHYFCLCVKEVN
mgnify:CR=1 FL=1